MPMLFVGWSLNYEMVFYVCVTLSLIISLNRSIFVATGLLAATYISLGYFAHSLVLNKFFGNELMYEFILGMLHLKYTIKVILLMCRLESHWRPA